MRISVNRDKHLNFVAGVVLVKKKNKWVDGQQLYVHFISSV